MKHKDNKTYTLILKTGEGRTYNRGPMTVVFKAYESETEDKDSISEWWLEPNSNGLLAHQHEDIDQIFYVLDGIASIFIAANGLMQTKEHL